MEKINEEQLFFARNSRLRLLILAELCILFLICSMTTVTAGSAHYDPAGSASASGVTTGNDGMQQDVVKGTVKDAATGEALIGVTVMVKGTTVGTITDINGQFTLRLPQKESLVSVSFIGYTTQELIMTQGSTISVSMQLEVTQMQEVVVVGYGTQKKESVVGAITQVNNAALMKSGTASVSNAIAGKLSGVLTIQNTGEPGANSSEIIVRGLSSWNGSQPLVLVDGVERDFTNIDPNEINTISVLKDASATAVFGAKGANGVIIVTTKRGSLGKPKLEFTGSFGALNASGVRDHIDSYTTMSMLNVARMNDMQYSSILEDWQLNEYKSPSSPLSALQYPDVDWFKELSAPFAPIVNANLNITGGTNFVKYFALFGYQNEGDFFKGYHDGYDDARWKNNRFNYRANVDFSLTGTTQLSLNLGGDVSIKNQPYVSAGSIWETLWDTGPSRFPAYFPDWVLEEVPDLDYPDATGWRRSAPWGERWGNPYSNFMTGSFRNYTSSRLFTDVILDQKLDFLLKGLSLRGKVSLSTYYNMTTLTADYTFPDYFFYFDRVGVDANKDGIVDRNPWERVGQTPELYNIPPLNINVGGLNSGYYTDLYYEGSINYANTFGKHTVSAMALLNRQQKNSELDFPYYNEALVGRLTYDYSRKYLLEVNLGYTGSERFAPGNRFGFFPSGAVGWTISEEPFFKNAVPWMNKLKVRYSDGLVGSDYASSRWLYISEYYTSTVSSVPYLNEDKGANASAQWEEARKRDIGIEIGLLKNMFTFSVDLFDENRTKMLLTPQSVTGMVGNSFKDLNLGSLKKHGIEVEAGFNKTTSYNLIYSFRGIFGFNENRVLYKDDLPYAPEYVKAAGKPLGMPHNRQDSYASGVLLTGSGYFTTVDDIHNNATPIAINLLNVGDYVFLDYNSDATITSKDKFPIKGCDYPPITYSLSSELSYKGFTFSFMFQGNKGKYVIYNCNFESEFLMGNYSVHKAQLDYWTPANQEANHSTLHYYSGGGGLSQYVWGGGASLEGYDIRIPGRFWRNADYLRLKDLFLGYTFDTGNLKRILGISNLQIYATGNNLLTFTKLIEGDPERKDFQTGFYPLVITVKLGLKLSF
jgi:TonB-linked SusC/RagA family outer membrane protein